MKRNGFVPVLILIFIAVVVGLGYYGFRYFKQNFQITPVINRPVSSTPTASGTPNGDLASWKTYTKDNFQIKYPGDWTISSIPFGFSVVQGKYQINIQTSNPGFGPGICIFSDSPNFNNPYTDNPIAAGSKCPGNFVQINGVQYTFRRRAVPVTSPDGVQTGHWTIYVKSPSDEFVTAPSIEYQEPINTYDLSTIKLMDQILSTFKFLNASTSPSDSPVACAQDAKLCSDGKTYVSRTGPNCEFATCPTP